MDAGNPQEWLKFVSEDGRTHVDFLKYGNQFGAEKLIKQRNESPVPHSGTMGTQEACFITICTPKKYNAVNAFVRRGPFVFNVRRDIPFVVLVPNAAQAGLGEEFDGLNSDEERKEIKDCIDQVAELMKAVQQATVLPETRKTYALEFSKEELLRNKRAESFAKVWAEVKFNFPFFEQRLSLNWDAVLATHMPRVLAAKSDEEYVNILKEVIALLQDGHCWVRSRIPGTALDSPPIQITSIEHRPVVTQLANLDTIAKDKIRPGMEITHVDGIPVDQFIKKNLIPFASASTPQDLENRNCDKLLRGLADTKVTVRLVDVDGNTTSTQLIRNSRNHRDKTPWRNPKPFEFKTLGDGIVYVALNTFADPIVVSEFKKEFKKIQEAKSLIIDVRANGGGSSKIGWAIVSHLIKDPAPVSRWRTRKYRPAHRSWGQAEEWHEGQNDPVKPIPGKPFAGKVVVLTSPKTYSAAEDFIVPLKASNRATLIGQMTGGSTGNPIVIDVHKAQVAIVSKWDYFPDGTDFVGVGISPEITVARSRKDIADGNDTVLQSAIDFLKN